MAEKPKHKSRKKLWLAVGILILAAALVIAYRVLTSNAFLQPRVERALTSALETECRIEGIEAGLFGGASLDRLSLFIPPENEDHPPSEIVARDCFAEHDWTQLLTGDYRLERVKVGTLNGTITQPFLDWMEKLRARPGRKEHRPAPEIEIETGTVSFDLPALRRRVSMENVNLLLGQENPGRLSGVASFRMGGNLVRLRINAVPRQSQGELELAVRGFDLSALPLLPSRIEWFEPSRLFVEGSLTGHLSTYLSSGPGSAPSFSGDFALAEMVAAYRGWPIELADGFGSFRITERGITLRNVTANVGRGRIAVNSGRISMKDGKLDHLSLRGTGRRLDLALLTHKTLPWSKYVRGHGAELEAGAADVDFTVQWAPGNTPSYECQLSLQDAAVTLPEFETRLADVRVDATVASPGRFSIENARARVAGGRAEVSGSFGLEDEKIENPHLEINLTDIHPRPDLVAKADPKTGELLKKVGLVNPETDGHISVSPNGMEAELDLIADKIAPEGLGYSLSDLSGSFTWSSTERRFTFRELTAKRKGGQIEATGSVRLEEKPEITLTAFGRSLPIDDDLLGLVPSETRDRFQDWSPRGAFDVEFRCRNWKVPEKLSLATLQDFQVETDLRNFSLSHAGDGRVLSNLYGHVSLQENAVNLTGFTGELLGKGFRAGGLLPFPGSDAQPNLQLESGNLSITPEWLRGCPFDAARKLAELDLRGACGIQARLSQLPDEEKPLKGSVTGVFHYLSLKPNDIPIRASGTARLNLQTLGNKGTRMSGELQLQDAGAGSLDADRVTGELEYAGGVLKAPVVRVGAYGGKVTITDTAIGIDSGEWNTNVEFSHMDFESLMGAFGVEGKETPSGVLRGAAELTGEAFDTEALEGNAQVKINRGRLYGFPILLSVFQVLDLGLPSQSPVTNAYGTFTLGGGRLKVDNLVFGGGGLPVLITGEVEMENDVRFKNQRLKLLVTVTKGKGLLDSIPIVNWIKHYTIDMLRSLILQARVTGTFTDYEISSVADPVTAPIKGLWSLVDKVTPGPPGGD